MLGSTFLWEMLVRLDKGRCLPRVNKAACVLLQRSKQESEQCKEQQSQNRAARLIWPGETAGYSRPLLCKSTHTHTHQLHLTDHWFIRNNCTSTNLCSYLINQSRSSKDFSLRERGWFFFWCIVRCFSVHYACKEWVFTLPKPYCQLESIWSFWSKPQSQSLTMRSRPFWYNATRLAGKCTRSVPIKLAGVYWYLSHCAPVDWQHYSITFISTSVHLFQHVVVYIHYGEADSLSRGPEFPSPHPRVLLFSWPRPELVISVLKQPEGSSQSNKLICSYSAA